MDKQKRKKLKTAAKGYAFIGINLSGVLYYKYLEVGLFQRI